MDVKPQVFEVTRENFEELVLQGSNERVIVVDLWAPWCAPCRTLGPVLEELVAELGPGVALAKVNVDENQELAMAFRVQGIPAVKIIKDGKLVQEFSGALPKEQVRALLEPLVETPSLPEDDLREEAAQLAEMGDLDGAARLYERILQAEPDDSACLLNLARIRLQQGDADAVRELVQRIPEDASEHRAGEALLTFIQFARICADSGGRGTCAQRVLADPNDLEARHALACCAAVNGDYPEALEAWLEVVQRDHGSARDAAKDAMVSVFQVLGRQDELVVEHQRRLYQALH